MRRLHLQPRYLLPESFDRFQRFFWAHPVWAVVSVLAVYAVVLAILRKLFGRITADMLVFAAVIAAIALMVGNVVHTLTHVPGFHFGG
jgi:hypothetical protein